MIANSFITSAGSPIDVANNINNYINGTNVTPITISATYGFPVNTGANTKVGIISLGGGWRSNDFNRSMSNLGLPITSANITTVLVDGATGIFGLNDSNASLENTLDLYCVAGIVPAANIVLYIGPNTTSGFRNVVQRAIDENCDTISISWGSNEGIRGSYFEDIMANAVSRGINVFAATGDYGSEGSGRPGAPAVTYPASSPNVVAVGGTSLTYNPSTYARISEVGNPSSGGGVSTFFTVPQYQSTAKANVFFSNNNYSYVTSLTSRGVPDMSAPYQFYPLWYNSNIAFISGTSASTPILAGMTARFISMNRGKRPPLQSFHELLYRADANNAFYDITNGNNTDYLTVGFAANLGWDAVTGMGAPNATNLYQVITSGGAKIKKTTNNWGYVSNVSVKTGSSTWTPVKNMWTKDATGTWKQIF